MVEFGTSSAFRGWVKVRVLSWGFGVWGKKVKSRDCALASVLVRAVLRCLRMVRAPLQSSRMIRSSGAFSGTSGGRARLRPNVMVPFSPLRGTKNMGARYAISYLCEQGDLSEFLA